MYHEQVEFHNISHVSQEEGCPGLSLHRVPDYVRCGLNETAQNVGLCPSHAEIRFVTDAPLSKLTLYSDGHHEYAFVYYGDFFVAEHCINPHETLMIELKHPEHLDGLNLADPQRFAPNVWRVRLSGTHRVHFVNLDTGTYAARAPKKNETPALRWLAYGSSITQGFSASRLANPWTQLAAQELRADLLNLGFGGSCHAEPALSDYMAEELEWNLCTLELGINLVDKPITQEEFRSRVTYMLQRLTSTHPDAKIVIITPFFTLQDLTKTKGAQDLHFLEDFRASLRAVVSDCSQKKKIYLIEGEELLNRWDGLSSDLCHPSDFGHALIAKSFVQSLIHL